MGHLKRYRPSPAMIVACVALILSLGGTSYAAIVLPAGSVGTKQLKSNAVVGSKVKAGSLAITDISSASLSKLSRIAYDIGGGVSVGNNAAARIAQVEIAVPKAGFVLVEGWVTASNANGTYYVAIYDDTASAKVSEWYNGCTASGSYSSVGNVAVVPVTAGKHLFSVRVDPNQAGAFTAYGAVTAQFIPYGATGKATSLPSPSSGGAAQSLPD